MTTPQPIPVYLVLPPWIESLSWWLLAIVAVLWVLIGLGKLVSILFDGFDYKVDKYTKKARFNPKTGLME